VRAETFRVLPEVGEDVAARVREEAGVTSVTTTEVTGSLLVLYDPRQTQVLRILRAIVLVGGLAGIEVDRKDRERTASPGERVRAALGALDARFKDSTEGRVDLRAAIPATLAALGVGKLLQGSPRVPEWYDLLFWSFVTFSNLNPRAAEVPVARTDARADG
jgi:hypothetical protein